MISYEERDLSGSCRIEYAEGEAGEMKEMINLIISLTRLKIT